MSDETITITNPDYARYLAEVHEPQRRRERLEIASRVMSAIMTNATGITEDKWPEVAPLVAKASLAFTDALIAAVDKP